MATTRLADALAAVQVSLDSELPLLIISDQHIESISRWCGLTEEHCLNHQRAIDVPPQSPTAGHLMHLIHPLPDVSGPEIAEMERLNPVPPTETASGCAKNSSSRAAASRRRPHLEAHTHTRRRRLVRIRLVAATLAALVGLFVNAVAQSGEAQKIDEWLKGYDAAFNAKDLDKLATFYHPDVTIYEGAGVNNGWVDYRDRHLGPELKAFENLQFGHSNRKVHMLGERNAYVISEYFIKAKMKERMLDSIGRETLILEKQSDGSWKIRHSHTSGRARPQQ